MTQEPFQAAPDCGDSGYMGVYDARGRKLALVFDHSTAKLFALAPEMAEALRECAESLARLPDVDGAYRVTVLTQARALLARLAP